MDIKKKSILLVAISIFLLVNVSLINAETFGYNNPTIPKLMQELFDGKPSSFYMPNNKTVTGDFSFDGLCINGGVEIKNGTICAQRLEVLNITNLNITLQDLTIINNLDILENLTVGGGKIILPSGTSTIEMGSGVTNFLVFDANATGSARIDFKSGSLAELRTTFTATSVTIEATDFLGFKSPDDMEFRMTSAGMMTFNAAMNDVDIIFKSDTNTVAGMSDGGLFGGKGAWGFGRTASSSAFFFIQPIAFEAVANVDILALKVTSNGITVPAGTTSNAGTVLIDEPKLTADGTITNAFTLKIEGVPTEGTNNYALWIDNTDGLSFIDGDLKVSKMINLNVSGHGNFTDGIFVNEAGDKYSRFGSVPSVFSPSDATDTLVSVSSVSTNINVRGLVGIGEYTGAVTKTTAGYGAITNFYHTGDGDNTNNAGEAGNRALWIGSGTSNTVERVGGVTASALIQNTADTMTVSEALYAFRAEGNSVKEANSIITNSYNFFGEVFAIATGTVTNNMGFIQQELTDGINNIEMGIGGEGILGFGLSFTGDVYDGGMPTEFIMQEIEDPGGDNFLILNLNALDFIDFTINGTKTTTFSVDAMGPVNNNEIDLANPIIRWRDLYLSGDADILGNGNFTGNLTGNMIHGSMAFHNDSIGNVTALTEDIWANFTGFDQVDSNEQMLNGVAYSNSILTIQVGGVYDISFGTSFSGTVNNKYHVAIGINGVEQLFCESHDRISTGTDILSASFPCSKTLSVGDKLMLMYMNEDSAGDVTTLSAQLKANRVGN